MPATRRQPGARQDRSKTGTGTLTLSGANTYSGGKTLSSGTLQVGNNSGTGMLAMAADTTLFWNTDDFTIANNIIISGDPFFTPPAGTTQTLSGAISNGSSPGVGTPVLSGVNTYSGGTVISSGVVQVTNNSTLGTGTVTFDGGTLQAGANNLTFTNAAVINATGGTIDTNGNNLTWSGVIANGNGAGSLTVANSRTAVPSPSPTPIRAQRQSTAARRSRSREAAASRRQAASPTMARSTFPS